MQKSLWLLALLVGVVVAPNAQAQTDADVSFTCATSCASMPTDPFVTFPSPTIPITFFSETFNVTLDPSDSPTDTYTWGVESTGSSWYFLIDDNTDGIFDKGPSYSFGGSGAPYGSGGVYFTCLPTPEPSSGSLMLLGLGIALVSWKWIFMGRSRSQAADPALRNRGEILNLAAAKVSPSRGIEDHFTSTD